MIHKTILFLIASFTGACLNAQDTLTVASDHSLLHLGYLSIPKEANTGSIESVSGTELTKSPVSSLSQMLTGRLTGMNVMENNHELFFSGSQHWIRGSATVNAQAPLVVIDGVPVPLYDMDYFSLSPNEIENITILKDGSSAALYGMQGCNGVIVITTKRGQTGPLKIQFTADQSFQQITRTPFRVHSADYAELRNQAGANDGLGAFSQYSQAEINAFRVGNDPLYPDNDWFGMFVKEWAHSQRIGLNISGGTDKVSYFTNLHYLHQSNPFKITDEPDRKYELTPNIQAFGFRSNVDVRLNKYLGGFIDLSGNVNRTLEPPYGSATLYEKTITLPSTMYGPLTPPNETNPELENQVITTDAEDQPIYGLLNRSGYSTTLRTNVTARGGVKLDMGFLTQGLSANAHLAFHTFSHNGTYTTQNFERYVRSSDLSQLNFSKKGSYENTPLVYNRTALFQYVLELSANINYSRKFGDHSIDALGFISYQKMERAADATVVEMFPYKRENLGVTALYGYLNKYFVKADFGYSGSEQFAPENRYTTTPAISASWIASKEDFLNNSRLLTYLKFRASYGISANDNLGALRFQYVDFVAPNGQEGLIGNPNLSPEKIKKQNYGVDLELFSQLSVSFDYFMHKTDNMLVVNSTMIPIFQGIPLENYPKINNGKMENRGFELIANYRRQLTESLSVFAGGGFSWMKDKILDVREVNLSEDYAYRKRTEGYMWGQQWGYLIDYSNGTGMFNTESELQNTPLSYSMGNPRVGDFVYQDLNNDRIIDEKDLAPTGNCARPRINYNLSGGFTYKNFDFSLLFQGTAKASVMANSIGVYEYLGQGRFNDIHLDAFTPERYTNHDKISYPALSLNRSTSHVANDFFSWDRSFLRLKNIEIAYTLPAVVAQKLYSDHVKIALGIQNVFTIHQLPTKHIDPEVMTLSSFQPWRTYNIGLSFTF